jgi:Clp amino terminal domain, pathogenicity island component
VPREPSVPYLEAIQRGFQLARELDRGCGPVHFLAGIAGGSGAAAAALDTGQGPSVREVVAAIPGDGAGYLHMQAQGAAVALAESLGQRAGPEHLLTALLDQGTPEVRQALDRAGLDAATVRRAALAAIGAADRPPLVLPPLPPAGTMDRPALPVADLDGRAWSALRWRQDHLPLDRLRRRSDWEALRQLERNAAWRLAERLGLDDDQRYSLVWQHADQVGQRMTTARPDLSRRPGVSRRMPRRPAFLNVTVGWGMWLRNRRVNVRDRWFRLRTLRYYRGAPQP